MFSKVFLKKLWNLSCELFELMLDVIFTCLYWLISIYFLCLSNIFYQCYLTALDTLFIKNPSNKLTNYKLKHGKCVDFYVVVKINFIMLFLVKRYNNRESLVSSWMFYLFFFNNFLESFFQIDEQTTSTTAHICFEKLLFLILYKCWNKKGQPTI